MRIDHAPTVLEIQQRFCPTRWESTTETKCIWVRDRATGVLNMEAYKGETEHRMIIEDRHKVIQSYVLRRLSDYGVRAVAIVGSGGGERIKVNEWNVLMINANMSFALRLHRSALSGQVQDEDGTSYSVANIGGGYVLTKLEYLAEKKRRDEATELYDRRAKLRAEFVKRRALRQQAEDQERRLLQREQEDFILKAKYALTGEDIRRMLPISPARSPYSGVHNRAEVLQVYTLINAAMKVYICAVISKRCNWLTFDRAGCHNYSFKSDQCVVSNSFTAIQEQSRTGIELLSKMNAGEVISIGQKQYLIVNIGGGNFVLHHTDWHKEKQEIEARAAVKLEREANKQRRKSEGEQDWQENRYFSHQATS